MIGLPPFDAGGVHETVAWALPATAVGLRTAVGGVATTFADGQEGCPWEKVSSFFVW